jgi:hypothetical protein
MKRIILTILTFFFALSVNATVLQAGVSVNEVPEELFGSWQISAKLDSTNSPATFKAQGLDFWNLSRMGDVISLVNPISGANSSVSVRTVEGNLIVFSKSANYDSNKVLTDIVTLRINENSFTGINELKLETYSAVDKHILKTETARYVIKGEKVAGKSILK